MFSEERRRAHSEVDGNSFSSSSGDSTSGAPSRLVPGHRMWANRSGRHVLGLIEDYNALRKQISEGRKLSRSMDAQLQDCMHALRQQDSDSNKVLKQTMSHWLIMTGTQIRVYDTALLRWSNSNIWRACAAAWTPCSRCWMRPVGCSNWCGESLYLLLTQQERVATTSR